MEPPKFSIIIPTRNEEALLGGALAAFPPAWRAAHGAELIVTDGASTDGTLALARAGADRVVEHRQPHRQTIAEGRNAGAAVARGSVLVFLNADARLVDRDRFFTRVAGVFAAEAVVAATMPVRVFPAEEVLADRLIHPVQNLWFHFLNVIGIGMGRGECQVIRRAAFDAVGGYDARLAAGEDFELFRRLRRRGRIAWLADCRVVESPRRYRAYGYRRVLWLWFRNATGVMFAGKSSSRTWDEVR